MSDKYLIVGLGNPGKRYEKTRHNVGFWVIELLAERHNILKSTQERKAITANGIIKGKKVILAKPQTYMNLSGESVRALMDYYKIPLEQVIIIHDDLDTPLGKLKLRKTGGHGGQNGIRNIILHTGTQEFARVRFGIGRPPGRMSAKDYVLQLFHGDDIITADKITERSADAVERWLETDIDQAMTDFNGDPDTQAKQPKVSPEEELDIALRAHELSPNDPKPLEKMARLYKRLRRLDDAVETHIKLAELHFDNDAPKSMIAEMERAVSIRPALVDVQERIAREYEALDNAKRATGRWLKLADYHIEQDDAVAALLAIEEALRLNPQHPKALELKQSLEEGIAE
jgi:PTH1 family peptidyl-tRNA hydrolase